ncbi:hypothetical protein BDV06DRAFT_217286 [Aspergillus oleicola]
MSRPLEGKFGIVTGGSRGIGEAIAKNLASKGCSLLLNFTSESSRSRTEELCQSLASTHSIRCVSVQADLSTPEQAVKDILNAAATHFPNTTIDILVNNAGVSADRTLNDKEKGPIEPEYFNWQYNINVLAPLLLTQAVAPHLPNDRSGRIVNISSVSSSLGFVGQSVYGGTKAALEAMTRTWARELADRATVNAVNPGPVTGDMYFKTGEGFWNAIQGFQDNTPLSKLVDGKEQEKGIRDPVFEELGLTEEQIRLQKSIKMPPRSLNISASTLRSSRALRTRIPHRAIAIPAIQRAQKLKLSSNLILNSKNALPSTRAFTTTPKQYNPLTSSSGKSQADLIVEELQELYETAQDELEIATESTDSATIYAASDRESARDALNSLVIAYELYTGASVVTGKASGIEERPETETGKEEEGEGEEGEERIVELGFDPKDIPQSAREEIKKRIGQRIREVKSAVEVLEKKAHD